MENIKVDPISVNAQDGQTLSVVGDTYRILMTGEQTGGTFAAIDMLIPPNGGPGAEKERCSGSRFSAGYK